MVIRGRSERSGRVTIKGRSGLKTRYYFRWIYVKVLKYLFQKAAYHQSRRVLIVIVVVTL